MELFFPLLRAARVWDLVTLLVDDGVSISRTQIKRLKFKTGKRKDFLIQRERERDEERTENWRCYEGREVKVL